jgi:hypothetical protein
VHEFGWQGHQSNPPKARLGPDYPGLIEFLLTLRPIPDALGEFIPSNKQAAQIRRCGFNARAGRRFLIPRLPDELVWFNELAQLSNQTDPFWYPAGWKPIRAAIRYIAPIDLLTKEENRIIGLLQNAPDHRRTRRDLQHYLSRKIPTWFLDRMLARLTELNRITKDDEGWIYPHSRAELESMRRRERERRLTPIYSIYPDGSTIWHRNP